MCGVSKAVWLCLAVAGFGLLPSRVGVQGFGASTAARAATSEGFRAPLTALPFGTIHAALLSFPRPISADLPDTGQVRLASGYLGDPDITGSIGSRALIDLSGPPRLFPEVNRAQKGDRIVPSPVPEPASAPKPGHGAALAPNASEPSYELASVSLADVSPADDKRAPRDPLAASAAQADASADTAALAQNDASSAQSARIYFGLQSVGMLAAMQPWSPEDFSMLDPFDDGDPAESPAQSGETIAPKGEVTGAGHHPKSPAERLGLSGAARAKAEKCLANAVYFEARDEPVRGQIAVAQVVMNRVFSGYYPDNVCGVVYQNANHRFACQFTFACDGTPDRIDEPDAWRRAKEIARDTLDGKLWLSDVGKATHYHAYWVRPNWIREMHKLDRIGGHTFYRPRNWGDGANAPVWGDAATTREEVKKL